MKVTRESSSAAASPRSPSASRRRRSSPTSRSRRARRAATWWCCISRRQRLAEHAHSVQRSASTTAAGRRSRFRRPTCCRSAPTRRPRARPASAADRPAHDLRRRHASRSSSAPATPTRADRTFSGTDIWSTANPANSVGHRLARPLSRYAAVAGRSADRLVDAARDAAPADGRHASACRRFPASPAYAFPSPNRRRRSRRSRGSADDGIASHLPVDRPHLAFVNATTQAAFATLDRVAQRRHLRADGDLSEQRLVAGAERRRRRDGARASARTCSGCRPAASTRTRRRAPTRQRRLRRT